MNNKAENKTWEKPVLLKISEAVRSGSSPLLMEGVIATLTYGPTTGSRDPMGS